MNRLTKYKILIISILIISSQNLWAQVTANFTAMLKQGCVPLEVEFINQSSTGTNITYHWRFGNGNTSVLTNPFAVYDSPGYYTVQLIVSNGTDSDTLTKTNYIHAFSNPQPLFTVTENNAGCVPYTVNFTNQTIWTDTTFSTILWDFGDGNTAATYNATNTYTQKGKYNISLWVTDKNGCSAVISKTDYIEAQKVEANFIAENSLSCSSDLKARFINKSSDTANISFLWYFGDNQTANQLHPDHIYTGKGSYNVSLVAVNALNCTDSISKPSYIKLLGVNAKFEATKLSACKYETIQFTNLSENAKSYQWSFSDNLGKTFSSKNMSHAFADSGNYTIQLVAKLDDVCTDTLKKQVYIEFVKAAFDNTNFTCQLPAKISYIDKSVNAISWKWLFGNGETATVQNPEINITNLKNNLFQYAFTDTLIVTNTNGCTDTLIKDSSVVAVLPQVLIYPRAPNDNFLRGCIPFSVNFKNQSIYKTQSDSIIQTEWDLSDGDITYANNAAKTFVNKGNHIITLTVTTQNGCTASNDVVVSSGYNQNADIAINTPDTVCAGMPVEFTSIVNPDNEIDVYIWNFGDSKVSGNEPITYHSYNTIGEVTPKLIVYSFGCATAITKSKPMFIKGPSVLISKSSNCSKPFDYTFNATVKDAENYYWDFGDNSATANNMANITHTYNSSGDYMIKFYAVNTQNGCANSDSVAIKVRNLIPDFVVSKQLACLNEPLIFDASISNNEYPFGYKNNMHNYLWTFGSDTAKIFSDNPVNYAFNKPDTVSVSVMVKDINGCSATKTKKLKIYHPNPLFKADYIDGCLPYRYLFTDTTHADTTIVSRFWTFGDTKTATDINPENIYQKFGNYSVSLQLTNVLGCTNTTQKVNFINVNKPDPDFLATDPLLCHNDSAKFFLNSDTEVASILWNFGDGFSSDQLNPVHQYPDTGYFTVKATVIDTHGCDTSTIKTNYIYIQNYPTAQFATNSTETECYPGIINYFDNTDPLFVQKWVWDFGDNTTNSVVQNPSHVYTKPGIYSTKLIVYTANQCSDTLVKHNLIHIKGPWATIEKPDTVCKNAVVTLTAANKTNVEKLKWDTGNGFSDTTTHITTTFNQWGYVIPKLLLYMDNKHTCDKIITDSLYIYEVTANFTTNKNHGCAPMFLMATNNSKNADYFNWFLNNYNISNEASYAGSLLKSDTLKLVINTILGCKDSISKPITVYPPPILSITPDTVLCIGNAITLNVGGAKNYSWNNEETLNNNSIANPVAQPYSTTRYTVIGVDSNSCSASDSVLISVQQVQDIYLNDTTIIIGELVPVNIQNPGLKTFRWSPNLHISCDTCGLVQLQPLETTTYTVSVTDTSQCFTTDYDITIDVLKKFSLHLPDIFTPNGDGYNDIIYVRGWGISELISFKIFNRYGTLVFNTNNINNGWDGTYKGAPQVTETYTYQIVAKMHNNLVNTKTGYFKLIR